MATRVLPAKKEPLIPSTHLPPPVPRTEIVVGPAPAPVSVPAIMIAKCPALGTAPCTKLPVGDFDDQQQLEHQPGSNVWTARFRITVTNISKGQVTLWA